jgi:hypothetical protein
MQTDIGTSGAVVLDMVPVSVDPKNADSVVVNNLAGATLNYYSNTCSAPAGTIAAAASQTFTTPVWIQSQGPRTSIRLTGGKYGNW